MTGIQQVITDQAPAAIGPYSQAVIADELVFVSGQIPIDPATGEMVEADIRIQTRRVLDNLTAVLDAAGSGLDSVVKVEVFLADMADFGTMNKIYAEYFDAEVKPARQAVEVSRLPKDALIEISCIAVR